jgi:hypothetical protein
MKKMMLLMLLIMSNAVHGMEVVEQKNKIFTLQSMPKIVVVNEGSEYIDPIILVREPDLVTMKPNQDGLFQGYQYSRQFDDDKYVEQNYFGKEALVEALEDLDRKYQNWLMTFKKTYPLTYHKNKIAFGRLFISKFEIPVYYATFAKIASVIKYINNVDEDTYESIVFVVPQEKEFNMYTEILSLYQRDKSTGKWVCY